MRAARYPMTLTVRTVEALQPEEKSYTAWDDKLSKFGVGFQPTCLHSYHGKPASGRPRFADDTKRSSQLVDRHLSG